MPFTKEGRAGILEFAPNHVRFRATMHPMWCMAEHRRQEEQCEIQDLESRKHYLSYF